MNLYDRDYTELTENERQWFDEFLKKESSIELPTFKPLKLPENKAVRHYRQLFPNHYLDPIDLDTEKELLSSLVDQFESLLDQESTGEREILNFVREKKSYFIVGSILKREFRVGHHAAYLFPEFSLGASYRVDFLLVGLGSGGYELVFVEFESPSVKGVLQDGELGEAFRKGIKQTEDWRTWVDAHFESLTEIFDKCISPQQTLPQELRKLDTSRIHYVVVASRRESFKATTYRARRRGKGLLLLHYDNLVDLARSVIGSNY